MSAPRKHCWIPDATGCLHCAGIVVALALLGCSPVRWAALPEPGENRVACFERVAGTLASDEMQGRGIGTRGLERAAEFLVGQFAAAGLEPAAERYRQSFQLVTGIEPGPGNALRWNRESEQFGRDFTPLGFSSSGDFEGSLVFAGYGTRADEIEYDDYADLEVRGKVVLAWRYEPGEHDAASPFDGKVASRWSDLRYKALLAREAGAAALILAAPPETRDADGAAGGESEERLPLIRADGALSDAGLPVLQVSRQVADAWLRHADRNARELHAQIDADYVPRSFEIPGLVVSGSVDLETTKTTVANIVGLLPGSGALAEETVVVGAHYDHLGFGGRGSMEPESRAIHNGADDNASGVAVLVCATRELAHTAGDPDQGRRTLLALAFTAEEVGLAGSAWYVRHPLRELDRTLAMVNLDMVGRLKDDRLFVLGTDSAPEWPPILNRHAAARGLSVESGGDGYGPSDQLPFYQHGIPVAHLFTGSHLEYHTPRDDLETLNAEGSARIVAYLARILSELLHQPRGLTYTAATTGPFHLGDTRGYGSYLGTIPDMSELLRSGTGVKLAGVREGGPADRAGLQSGDRIVAMAGIRIRNLYDMTFVLREHRPGEVIEIEVVRGSDLVTTSAKLGERGATPPAPDSPAHPPEPAPG